MKIGGHEVIIRGRLVRTASLAAEGYAFLEDPVEAVEKLVAQPRRVDLLTFTQEPPHTTPRYEYPMEWDDVAAVPVSTFAHWHARQIKDKTRNMLRRGERAGLTVREVPFDDGLVRGIMAIYNEWPTRQGRRFKHYGKRLEIVRRESATFLEHSVFLGAFVGDELVGFAKIVKARHHAALMQILSMLRHRDKAPTNALIARAVAVCEEQSVPHLVYGRFSYGRRQADPLSDFKRHNGFQRLDIPRYHVPLTAIGRAALRLGMHRGLRAWVPQPVLTHVRTIRARWWAHRFPVGGERT
jgi:hypothetical protein